jgi:hypothetical protein
MFTPLNSDSFQAWFHSQAAILFTASTPVLMRWSVGGVTACSLIGLAGSCNSQICAHLLEATAAVHSRRMESFEAANCARETMFLRTTLYWNGDQLCDVRRCELISIRFPYVSVGRIVWRHWPIKLGRFLTSWTQQELNWVSEGSEWCVCVCVCMEERAS